jgi:hypothetical protein
LVVEKITTIDIVKTWTTTIKSNWAEVYADKTYFIKFIFNFIVCYALYMWMVDFLVQNRFRDGVMLHDPIQQLFVPRDFSFQIFTLTYACTIAYLVYIIPFPRYMFYVFRAFLAVFVLRAAFIYLVPLKPPINMIFLIDPFTQFFLGSDNLVLNDLFYSGHIASLCIFIFCCSNKPLQYFMAVCTTIIAFMLMWQHVHYTADVVAAPFFAYACYIIFVKDPALRKH